MNRFYIKFDELKVGQSLWDVRYGEVTITHLNKEYPITVISKQFDSIIHYTKHGKQSFAYFRPVLFLSDPFEVINYPKLMWVSNDNYLWTKRIVVFQNAQGFIALTKIKSMDKINDGDAASLWHYAKDLE